MSAIHLSWKEIWKNYVAKELFPNVLTNVIEWGVVDQAVDWAVHLLGGDFCQPYSEEY